MHVYTLCYPNIYFINHASIKRTGDWEYVIVLSSLVKFLCFYLVSYLASCGGQVSGCVKWGVVGLGNDS